MIPSIALPNRAADARCDGDLLDCTAGLSIFYP
jgi:hypothetical protein